LKASQAAVREAKEKLSNYREQDIESERAYQKDYAEA